MKKKEYKEPRIRVAKLNTCRIFCTSDIIDKGELDTDEMPQPNQDGYIFGE